MNLQSFKPRSVSLQGRMNRVATLSLNGEIGRDEWFELAELLKDLRNTGNVKVVIDLAEVDHCDFRGLKPLAEMADAFREAGGDLKLSGVSPYLFQIFKTTGEERAFDFFSEVQRASLSFEPVAQSCS